MKGIITIGVRQEIDAQSNSHFARDVWHDSFHEYCMQSQAYNNNDAVDSFRGLLAANPKAASLHYKVGFAVGLYFKKLEGKIPGIWDSLQQIQLPFNDWQLSIADSSCNDPMLHKVAITYTTPPLLLLGVLDGRLWLSAEVENQNQELLPTFLLPLSVNISITGYTPAST